MQKRFIFLLGLLMMVSLKSTAIKNLQPNAQSQTAYELLFNLQLTEGRNLAQKALLTDPQNIYPLFILDYADCLELLLNGNPKQYAQLKKVHSSRYDALDECSKQNPYLLFIKSSMNFHWAAVNFRFGEQWNAVIQFRKAFEQIKDNHKLFPQFSANQLLLGFTTAIAGTIPEEYDWLSGILGLRGNINQGIGMIENYIQKNSSESYNYLPEATIYQYYLKYYLQKRDVWVWQQISGSNFYKGNQYLNKLVAANIALNYRKSSDALSILNSIPAALKNKFPVFWYETGLALQMKLDPQAIKAYQNFLYQNKGKWYMKSAWEQIALLEYIFGNTASAKIALSKIALYGNTVVDPDKQAQSFANNPVWPNTYLYKAYMLTNGGYYSQALAQLAKVNQNLTRTEQVEKNFRYARIYDDTHQDDEAITFYTKTYDEGKDLKEQYAARAALFLAKLFEDKKQNKQALIWYRKCLSLRHHDYQVTIDNQAKAGISRLGGY